MSAFVIADVTVTDPAGYERYKQLTPAAIAAFGGRFVARGGEAAALEGDWQPARLVIVEFPSLERARAWYDSVEYREAKALRQQTARTNMLIVDGV
jgi:uncharacterized protein (DUF1330 family)